MSNGIRAGEGRGRARRHAQPLHIGAEKRLRGGRAFQQVVIRAPGGKRSACRLPRAPITAHSAATVISTLLNGNYTLHFLCAEGVSSREGGRGKEEEAGRAGRWSGDHARRAGCPAARLPYRAPDGRRVDAGNPVDPRASQRRGPRPDAHRAQAAMRSDRIDPLSVRSSIHSAAVGPATPSPGSWRRNRNHSARGDRGGEGGRLSPGSPA